MWFVYLIRCSDGSLYCGITTDLERRYRMHCVGKGAKYTRSHRPVELAWSEGGHDHSSAAIREAAIKKMAKRNKERLISGL